MVGLDALVEVGDGAGVRDVEGGGGRLPLPRVFSLSATFAAPSALMSVTTTVSPRATRDVAIARPMPDAPPVTIAMLIARSAR